MPRGKRTTVRRKTGAKRRFATPIRRAGARRGRPPGSKNKPVQERTSAKSIVLTKFENLEADLTVLRREVAKLVQLQRGALLDNYRNYFIQTQHGPQKFRSLVTKTADAVGVTVEDLEEAVADLKPEPQTKAPEPAPEQPAPEVTNHHAQATHDDLLTLI